MADEKFNPVAAGNDLAGLKGLADFVDDFVPIAAHDHDRAVSAGSPVVPPESKTIDLKGTKTEDLLAMGATPEGRARVAALFGFKNVEGKESVEEVLDVFQTPEEKTAQAEFVRAIGGEEKMPEFRQSFAELIALTGVDVEEALGHLSPADANKAILHELAEYNAMLADPKEAAAQLKKLWSNPHKEPMKSYIHGRSSPAFSDVVWKLRQAAHGEKPVGRAKPKGDGQTY